jgi:Disulfide bond formation protein DsbB
VTDFVVAFLALLAVLAHVALALLLLLAGGSLVSSRARVALEAVRAHLAALELPLAWTVAAVATAGSLFFSEVADFVPCRLCWYQRYAMYPLVALLALAAFRRLRPFVPLLLPIPLVGLAVSVHDHYIERNPEAESAGCKTGIPCSTRWIWEFGYVSIPVLAGTAFALISILLVAAWRSSVHTTAE